MIGRGSSLEVSKSTTESVIHSERPEEALADAARNVALFGSDSMIAGKCFVERVHDNVTVLSFCKVFLYLLAHVWAEITIHIIGKAAQQGSAR